MVLFGVAAVIISVAVFVFSVASLCKALGLHVPEARHELTEEEKDVLKTQAEANKAYMEGIQNIMSYGLVGGGS